MDVNGESFNGYKMRFKRFRLWKTKRSIFYKWSHTFLAWDLDNEPECLTDSGIRDYKSPSGYSFSMSHVVLGQAMNLLAIGTTGSYSLVGALIRMAALAIPSIMYGVIHLLALRAMFPTKIEEQLWLISSVLVIVCTAYFLGVIALFSKTDLMFRYESENWLRKAFDYIILATLVSAVVLNAAARIFLVLGSFLSLRSLPLEAYQTRQWAEYWPHL